MKRASSWISGYGWAYLISIVLRWIVVAGVSFVLALVLLGTP